MKRSSIKIDFSNSWVDKSKPVISISKVLEMIQEPFDSEGVAQSTYDKHYNDKESQYYHMTVHQILEAWENKGAESRKYGSLLDDYIGAVLIGTPDDLELYKLNNDLDGDERLKRITASFDEWNETASKSLEFVDRERYVYYDCGDFYVRGRFDALFASADGTKLYNVDWKSTDKIETERTPWTKKLLGAAKDIDALNSNVYALQTFFYKTALAARYTRIAPEKIVTCIVNLPGHSFPDGKTYKVFPPQMPYNKEQMDRILQFAYKKKCLLDKKA